MKKTIYINFFGAPGAGKSTIAAGLFYKLKLQGWSVELVLEFAKELVYSDRKKCLADQFYVSAKQNHRLAALDGQVDFVVTDSPMLLGAFYAPKNYSSNFSKFLIEVFNSYNNVNFYVNRVIPYVQEGRIQSEKESDKKAKLMKAFLKRNNITTLGIAGSTDSVDFVVECVNSILQKK